MRKKSTSFAEVAPEVREAMVKDLNEGILTLAEVGERYGFTYSEMLKIRRNLIESGEVVEGDTKWRKKTGERMISYLMLDKAEKAKNLFLDCVEEITGDEITRIESHLEEEGYSVTVFGDRFRARIVFTEDPVSLKKWIYQKGLHS